MKGSIRFGEWVWDPNTLELRNGAHVATLEPRVARLLEYLVTHPGELLSHDRIIEAVWDGRIVSDEAVRRAVFSLRQALGAGGADSYIRTIHKKGYVASFPTPVAVDRAPPDTPTITPTADTALSETAIAPTPKAPHEVEPAPLRRSRRRLRLLGLGGAVALIALVATVLARLDMPSEQPAATEIGALAKAPTTLAILPFVNFSEESTSELLANGLTEELFGTLERNRELQVTARSSAFQFNDQSRDVRAIGQRLGVRYVLDGNVRRNADQVKVQAELVDVETETPLWTETYDRALVDWFALQQEIASDVARAVQRELHAEVEAVARAVRPGNGEAQLELLRARQLLITRSVADAEQAIEHLQRALTLDPNYALAYARLADAILIQAESTTGIDAARPVVAPLLDKALTLDPELGEAYALRSRLSDDPVAAERDLRRGLELNPSYARGYEMLANLQTASMQQLDLALDSIDRAIALDPLTPGYFHSKALLMMRKGYWPEAAEMDRRALELNPKFRAALEQLGQLSAVEGNFAEAIDYTEQALAIDQRAVPLRDKLVLLYLAVGDVDSARAVNIPPTDMGQLLMLWAEGNMQDAANLVLEGKLGQLELLAPELVSQILLREGLSNGDLAPALTRLSNALPFTDSLPPDARGWSLYAYANLQQLLDAGGNTSAASRLQEELDDRMATHESRYPRYAILYGQVRAVMLAHAGHSEEACAALERTHARAPRVYWRMVMSNPAFDDMRSMPCFQALLIRFEAYVSAERVRIEAMRRAGEIPDRSKAKPEQGIAPATLISRKRSSFE